MLWYYKNKKGMCMVLTGRPLKKTMLRAFLLIEASIFAINYFFGSQGLYALRQMRTEKQLLQVECGVLQTYVTQLSAQRDSKRANSFYQEKIAREHLQMAHPDEKIYYRTS
jgi:cell division protein FtsB